MNGPRIGPDEKVSEEEAFHCHYDEYQLGQRTEDPVGTKK